MKEIVNKTKNGELIPVHQTIKEVETFGVLGKEIKVSPKSKISVNKPGHKREYFTLTVDVLIGIGKDHTASLIMDWDAWEALKSGEKINVETLKQFKKGFHEGKKG